MASAAANRLFEQFEERFGDELRIISYYDSDEDEIVYIREDIEGQYEEGDRQRVFREARLQAIDNEHQKSMYIHGSLQCTLRFFEDAKELHIIISETEGIIAAVNAGAVEDLQETIDTCRKAIGE